MRCLVFSAEPSTVSDSTVPSPSEQPREISLWERLGKSEMMDTESNDYASSSFSSLHHTEHSSLRTKWVKLWRWHFMFTMYIFFFFCLGIVLINNITVLFPMEQVSCCSTCLLCFKLPSDSCKTLSNTNGWKCCLFFLVEFSYVLHAYITKFCV